MNRDYRKDREYEIRFDDRPGIIRKVITNPAPTIVFDGANAYTVTRDETRGGNHLWAMRIYMDSFWVVVNLRTGNWWRVEPDDAAWFLDLGATVRLVDESEAGK